VFDFAAMGLDGIEPDVHVKLRKRVMDNPLLASFANDMPKEAVTFATSPMNIAEQAQKMIEAGEI
jgi:hypothetical protein